MGNHHHESHRTHTVILLSMLLILPLFAFYEVSAQPIGDGVIVSLSDYQVLLAFKREADPKGILLRSWNGTRQGTCSGKWAGLKCVKGQVVALQLPFKGLGGRITAQIGLLRGLRRISLHDNYLMGMVPSSIALLPNLRGLHLFNNRLSGSIPPSIGRAPNLQNVDLSSNFLAGSIPPSIGNASRLYRLNLSFNSLSGSIPDGVYLPPSLTFLSLDHNNLSGPISDTWGTKNSSSRLQVLSLSHNRLSGLIPTALGDDLESLILLDLSENNFTGKIPASLRSITNLTSFNVSHNSLSGEVPSGLLKKFGSSAFVGNLQLCGYSSSALCPSSPPPENISPSSPAEADQRHRKRKLSTKDIILILVGAILALLLLLCCVLLCCLIRKRARRSQSRDCGTSLQKEVAAPRTVAVSGSGSGGGNDGGKLVLFDGPIVFTADDLLCATAEVMGKNAYGTVYKASMDDGNQVAVKRLREKLAKSPKEFEIEVAALGRIRHPNLLPLRAYYLGPKGEKLLVFDCVSKGSLSSFLHGHGPETSVDWPTRMKIALGITRGLHHLHVEENIAHGNLTASEVYLEEQNEPKISDYGVSRLMTDSANTNVIATAGSTGYRAPELQKTKKATTKSDIYSLGVIMLELLTGKPPGDQIDGVDLPQWVASTVKEEWTNEVFDLELMRDASATGDEMLNTLKLALHLVDPSPEARPEVMQVLQQLEEINPMLAVVPLQKVTIGGSTLASLLHRSTAAPGDTDGLLFGRVSLIAPSLSDDNHSAKSAALVATISGSFAAGTNTSFYDSAGNLDLVSLRRFLPLSPSHHLLGWFSARRRSPPRPSVREFSVSRSLSSDSEFAFSVENSSSSFFFPSIFLLLTTPYPNPQTLIHTHDYRVYQFSTSATAFETKPVDIVNIGPAFRGHYSNFCPNSELPYLSCNFKGSSMEGTDSLTYMKTLLADQRQLDLYVQGSRVLDLNKFLYSESANYTSGLEDLYEQSLTKLGSLAKLVQSSLAKVLEQENCNARLRDKVAGLD